MVLVSQLVLSGCGTVKLDGIKKSLSMTEVDGRWSSLNGATPCSRNWSF
jgi:uncharacterized protein YceK